MRLQDLASIGEFVGAVGAIGLLVYLTTQIRQNTRALQAGAHQDTTRDASEFTAQIADDAEVARMIRVGLRDWRELNDDECMRFSTLLFRMFFNFPNLYSLHRQGNTDSNDWVSQHQAMLWYMEQPGVRHWWSMSKGRLNRGFVEYVEKDAVQRGAAADTQGSISSRVIILALKRRTFAAAKVALGRAERPVR